MIETKSKTHILRTFATQLKWTDIFRVVLYTDYLGDKLKIPFYYKLDKGHSCVTDLSKTMDEIMASMKSNTRNEIRRAIKEGCKFEVVEDAKEFIPFYNAFCESKGFPDFVDEVRLKKFKHLLITKAVHNGATLSMHANLIDAESKTALLILSGSQRLDETSDKKMVGWGNRFLHYKDLEWLKSQGCLRYDWSGVCMDPNDERYSIGQFKLAFGGTLIDSWSLMSPLFVMFNYMRDFIVKFRK